MSQTREPLLKVENLSVTLDEKKIISGVSFEIEPQKVLAVIGPNGSGKSVLLKTLLGFIKPTHGTILWRPEIKIGYLPQRFHVDHYLPMTVEEFLSLKPESSPHAIEKVLTMMNLEAGWQKKSVAHLSGGELQQALLAWALIGGPDILLFDEPTENVDVVGQASIYKLLHNLQDTTGVAIIIVSHDLHVVYRYADHVLCLNEKMICYGEPQAALTTEKLSELYGDHAFFHHNHFQKQT